VGKSTVAAALALTIALLQDGSLVLLCSPSLRQSAELFLRVLGLYRALGRPIPTVRPRDNTTKLELANGSRIVSLPGSEATIRGYSGAALMIIDESARVPDDLYRAVRPMLAISRGLLACLSTPWGKRGWFYEEWQGPRNWCRVEVNAFQCPRIPADFLDEEKAALGDTWFRQEYMCSFEDTLESLFRQQDIEQMLTGDVQPLF
jgi:hypothetical protein